MLNRNKIIKKIISKINENKVFKLYHGSKSMFKEFDKAKQISGFYPGVYLASTKEMAFDFGKYIYEVEVKGQFFEFESNQHEEKLLKESGRTSSGWLLAEKLKEDGYIGIKRGKEYIVFEPKKIIITGYPQS
jgi:hypothetical protein